MVEAILLLKACSNLFLFKYVQWNVRLTWVPPTGFKIDVSVTLRVINGVRYPSALSGMYFNLCLIDIL
jgi:hypothetical protein